MSQSQVASFERFDTYVKNLILEESSDSDMSSASSKAVCDHEHARTNHVATMLDAYQMKTLARMHCAVNKMIMHGDFLNDDRVPLIKEDGSWSVELMRIAGVFDECDIGRPYTAIEHYNNTCKLTRTLISTVKFRHVVRAYLINVYGVRPHPGHTEQEISSAHFHANITKMEYLSLPYHETSNTPGDKHCRINDFLFYE